MIPPLAIRDKSTWLLGTMLFESGNLSGPDSHWTASISRDRSRTTPCCGRLGRGLGQQYDRALVP